MHQITAVINNDIRLNIQCFINKRKIFFFGASMPGKHMKAIFNQRGSDVILRGKRIAAGNGHLRSCMLENFSHIGGFGLQMQCDDHLFTCKWLGLWKFLIDSSHYRHKVFHPFDLVMTGRSQFDITNHGFHKNASLFPNLRYYHILTRNSVCCQWFIFPDDPATPYNRSCP